MYTSGRDPLVSVLMGIHYAKPDVVPLERSIRSILAQSFDDFELLICEYGSTEEARQRVARFAEEDRRVRLISGREPGTLSQNLNDGLACAKGEYIARMDDDDFSHPDRLEKQLAYLDRHPQIAFVGCNAALIRDGLRVGERILPEMPTVRDFYMTQPFLHPTLVFRRRALERVNGYSEGSRQVLCEDYDLLLRLYAQGFFGSNLQEVLFDYTLPNTARGGRKMSHRWNETVTRWERFKELGLLPSALPWTVKPLLVGLLPEKMLARWKKRAGTGG